LVRSIGSMPMVQVGKRYGVSDNAVRKWARQYGIIPYLSADGLNSASSTKA